MSIIYYFTLPARIVPGLSSKKQVRMTTVTAVFHAPDFGWCGLAGSDRGLGKIYLPEPDREALLGRMRSEFPAALLQDGCFNDVVRELLGFFSGAAPAFTCRLDFGPATDFQKKVWQAARAIAYGRVRTYGWLAAKIGNPRAMRAVGAALGRNPFPIIIPCHRVIRSDGGLGGFSAAAGTALKKKLLELEGVSF